MRSFRVLTIAPLLFALAPGLAAQASSGIRGDVNGDGQITAVDALAILSHTVLKPLPEGYSALPHGDANGDGEVTAIDALIVLSYVVGKDVTQFPIGRTIAGPPVRFEIAPGSLLVPRVGASDSLRVRAWDANGVETEVADVQWSSTDAAIVGMSADGLATGVAIGSARVIAQVPNVGADTILALVAEPTAGAILIADGQVVGSPVAVDTTAAYGVGFRYQVTLTAIAPPAVGSILIGTGEAPVVGRVVAVSGGGAQTAVTLELIPLPDIFRQLVIRETVTLAEAPVEFNSFASHEQLKSANITHYGAGNSIQSSASEPVVFLLGPFRCEANQQLPIDLSPTVTANASAPRPTLDWHYENGLRRMIVSGTFEASIGAGIQMPVGVESQIDCERRLQEFELPITGWLHFFFGAKVPVGVGFAVTGRTEIARPTLEVSLSATGTYRVGMDCPDGPSSCTSVHELTRDATGPMKLGGAAWDPASQFRVKLNGSAYGFAALEFGNSFVRNRLRVAKASAGLELATDLSWMGVQAKDATYASGFGLSLFGKVTAGRTILNLAELLRFSLVKTELKARVELASSPRGTLAISPARVRAGDGDRPGERANFTVTLNPTTFLGSYAVNEVHIRWWRPSTLVPGDSVLLSGPSDCSDLMAEPGQTVFTCEADFGSHQVGEQTFVAFVTPSLFGIPLPPIEISPDSRARLRVDTASVAVVVTPQTATLRTGETHQFAATVTGTEDHRVTWSATGGTVDSSGLYTAGQMPGTYRVVATSVAAPSSTDTATVEVVWIDSVRVHAARHHLGPGDTLRFTAEVTGTTDQRVTWTAEGGMISPDGLFTAGPDLGRYRVVARSMADAEVSGTRSVWIARELGNLGADPTWAHDINRYDMVVGHSQRADTSSHSHAVLWDRGTTRDLVSNYWHSQARSINDHGQVVGHGLINLGEAWGTPRYIGEWAFRWEDGVSELLVPLGNFEVWMPDNSVRNDAAQVVYAWDNNNRGWVVGAYFLSGGGQQPYLWKPGSMTHLGHLGGGSSAAHAINDAGQVVGWSRPSGGGPTRAFLWQNGVMADLGGPTDDHLQAHGINEHGQIIGNYARGLGHAVIWKDGAMTILTPGGGHANDINDRGEVVGWLTHYPGGPQVGYLWRDGEMEEIPWMIPRAINREGRVVGVTADGRVFLW